jgi:hypothetical protein
VRRGRADDEQLGAEPGFKRQARFAAAPEISSVEEAAGLCNDVLIRSVGIRRCPRQRKRLRAAVVGILADARWGGRLGDLGSEIPPPDRRTPKTIASPRGAEVREMAADKAADIKAE